MNMNLKRTLLGIVGTVAVMAIAALVALVAFDAGPLARKSDERTLTLLYWQAPSTPNPYMSGGLKDRDAGAITLEPLAKYNPDGALVPALAAEIPTLDNGGIAADLTSIIWTLRDDLSWSDGSDLTADDVVFTWQYCADEATGCTASGAFSDVASVEALDALTVRVAFHGVTPYPVQRVRGDGRTGPQPGPVRRLRRRGPPAAATRRTWLRWARGRIASSASRPTRRSSTSATRTTTGRSPTSTRSCSGAAAMRCRQPRPSWRTARPTSHGTCKSTPARWPRWRPWATGPWRPRSPAWWSASC